MNFYEKNKKIIWLGVLIAGAIIVYRAIRKKVNPLLTRNKPLVVANNGRVGTGKGLDIDNSISNIKTLLENKVDIIEISIQLSSDNIPVLFKDKTLDKLSNGFGFVQSKTSNQLKTYSYKAYPNEKIALLSDAMILLKQYNPDAIFYITNLNDYNYYEEITLLNEKGFFKGFENNFLLRGTTADKPVAIYNAGLLYMNTIPFDFVGKLNNKSSVSQIVKRSKEATFLRLQFNENDTFVFSGELANQLETVGCKLYFDPFDVKLSIPKSLKNDTETQWNEIYGKIKAKALVTNNPLLLQAKINQ
jgi:hypothetical protein